MSDVYKYSMVLDHDDNIIFFELKKKDESHHLDTAVEDNATQIQFNSSECETLWEFLNKMKTTRKRSLSGSGTDLEDDEEQEISPERIARIISEIPSTVKTPYLQPRKLDFSTGEIKKDEPEYSPVKSYDRSIGGVMTHRTNVFEELENPDQERLMCKYSSHRGRRCDIWAQVKQIYCEHHLYVSSQKMEENKVRRMLKRSGQKDQGEKIDYSDILE